MPIDPCDVESFGKHRSLAALVSGQCTHSQKHGRFLARRFEGATEAELDLCNELAQQVLQLAGDELDSYFAGYDFFCAIQVREEIYFRRHGAYRLKTLKEAIETVYSDTEYMKKYMRGLLLTQVFWSNHTASMEFFRSEFLAKNNKGADILEIGPGHGLLFARALNHPSTRSATGWDISPASIDATREALTALGVTRGYNLVERNIFDGASGEAFDAVIFSEILEHLDDPLGALKAVREITRAGGRVYINVPICSPSPDHIFLLESPEEAERFVRSCGFDIERAAFFPATNYTLDAARKHKLTISTCIVATKAAA